MTAAIFSAVQHHTATGEGHPAPGLKFIANNFIAGGFMSKTSGGVDDPVVRQLPARIPLGHEQEKLKPVYAELLRHVADQAYYCWFGFFAASNPWRDRVKDFRPSLGVAINVHDVSVT